MSRTTTKTPKSEACPACGRAISPRSDNAVVVAVRGPDVAPLRACNATCAREFSAAEGRKRSCRTCGTVFTPAAGKSDVYCSRGCETSAERRRRQVWHATAEQPVDEASVRDALAEVAWLEAEIDAGQAGTPPASARKLLAHRSRVLTAVLSAIATAAPWPYYDAERDELRAFLRSAGA